MERKGRRNIFRSIGYALKGFKYILIDGTYFKIGLLSSLLVIIVGLFIKLSTLEWALAFLLLLMTLILEILNTIIEKICDEITNKYNANIGHIKDMASLMVMLMTILTSSVGLIIAIPKIIDMFK